MPIRFVATTYNLWESARWTERVGPLRTYVELARPDVLCVQELRPASLELLDSTLIGHDRVHDDFGGWAVESNIWWSRNQFREVDHGAVDVGQLSPLRRLFWVRLQPTAARDESTVVVSTAHLTWQGNPEERETGASPRLAETRRVISALGEISDEAEPVLFMGDFNDTVHVARLLREAGFRDSFASCGAPLQPTHPAQAFSGNSVQVLDWQFHTGPIRVLNSHVGDFHLGDVAPSDHKPVVVTYGLD